MAGPLRILVADDEPGMRRSLEDILLDEGHTVCTAADGWEAVAACEQAPFDVVLLDVRMPGLEGVETFRRIRRHRADARVILMSAYGGDDLRQQALAEGAALLLPRPLDPPRLLSHIAAGKPAVLLLDVEPAAEPARSLLAGCGCQVTLAGTPHDALERAEQTRFDLLLVGLDLPAGGGRDHYLAIRQFTPAAWAVLIFGADDEFAQRARTPAKPAYTFIRKPLDLDHLLGLLGHVTRI